MRTLDSFLCVNIKSNDHQGEQWLPEQAQVGNRMETGRFYCSVLGVHGSYTFKNNVYVSDLWRTKNQNYKYIFKMTDIREITRGLRDVSAAESIDYPRRGLKFSSQHQCTVVHKRL